MSARDFTSHDHAACVENGVAAAEARCAKDGLRLTPVRRRVLEILLARHRALGAYDILDTLREEGLATAPPAAYRALDFLVSNGFAHRVERLNAFVACTDPGAEHVPAFLICRACDAVAETRAAPLGDLIADTASGFAVERAMVEAEGLCPACAP